MSKQDLIKQIAEEIIRGNDLGYDYEDMAKNILAIIEGERTHLDYDSTTKQYEWENDD